MRSTRFARHLAGACSDVSASMGTVCAAFSGAITGHEMWHEVWCHKGCGVTGVVQVSRMCVDQSTAPARPRRCWVRFGIVSDGDGGALGLRRCARHASRAAGVFSTFWSLARIQPRRARPLADGARCSRCPRRTWSATPLPRCAPPQPPAPQRACVGTHSTGGTLLDQEGPDAPGGMTRALAGPLRCRPVRDRSSWPAGKLWMVLMRSRRMPCHVDAAASRDEREAVLDRSRDDVARSLRDPQSGHWCVYGARFVCVALF